MMAQYLSIDDVSGDERIDSRDLIELRELMRGELEEVTDAETLGELHAGIAAIDDLEQDAGTPDWAYGEGFIREDTFEDYARELADDIGAIDANANWPLTHIDWQAAADALAQDYTLVTFLGYDYYVRS